MTRIAPDGSTQSCVDCGGARSGKFRRGRCENCYRAFMRALKGKPARRRAHRLPGITVLYRSVEVAGGCWRFNGYINDSGYGEIETPGVRRRLKAHRAVWQLAMGDIPPGMEIDHLCHGRDLTCPGGTRCMHRRCVNPAHLEPVTPLVNNSRGKSPSGTNGRKTHCIRGHEFTPDNTVWRDPEKSGLKRRRQCRACQHIRRERRKAARP